MSTPEEKSEKSSSKGEMEAQPRDASAPDATQKKLLKQVEFYFSDSNLPRDKFLKGLVKEGKGWVPLKTIADFKRIVQLLKAHSDNAGRVKALADALRKSKELLVVSTDNQFIKRTTELPQEAKLLSLKRSVYVGGLPDDATIEAVSALYEKAGASVRCVRLQRSRKEKKFLGCAYVELKDEEEATKLANQELKYPGKDTALTQQKLEAFFESKRKDKDESGKKRKKPQAEDTPAEAPKEEAKEEPLTFPKDRLLNIDEIPAEQSRESIKEFLEGRGAKVAWVDFNRGDTRAVIRLEKEEGDAASVFAKKATEEKAELAGATPKIRALAGEEEEKYWQQLADLRKAKKGKKGRGAARRGGRGGRGRGRGRPAKRQKV